MSKYLIAITLSLYLLSCGTQNQQASQSSQVTGVIGDSAMVVTAHPLASEVGVQILRMGGNAIDAAIATQFALAVVYPRAGNIGGGGFAVIRLKDGSLDALDFREKAPAAATKTMYQDENGEVISEMSTLGHLAVGVPGSVAGMWELHQKYGTIHWTELIQPAINLAFEGHFITADEAETLNEKQPDFKQANTWEIWAVKESGWNESDYIKQPQLAATLSFIRDFGKGGFYDGIVADQIYKEMIRGGGLITKQDLLDYEAIWRDPIITYYKEHKVIGMGPPSSGGIATAQLLHGAEQHDLGKYEHNSAKAVHLMAELEKRVFADRAEYLGDMDFTDVPIEELISKSYNAERFQSIKMNQVTPSSELAAGVIMEESMQTTHFSIVDQMGNAIAITTTLNGNYGSKVMVKGAGFFLNNEMDDFSSKPGVPNMFGLIGAEANSIAPGKRMLSAMTPTIVEKDGNLKMVLGTPGGSTIITSVFQTIINVLEHDMTMQEAVNAKKVHHQWLPDWITVEEGAITPEAEEALKQMGHEIAKRDKIGRTDCILVREDGTLEGGADPRGDDTAMGY